ncbi:hypothetical protein IFM46972_08369 [Aspergillus udagawae]|uniref:Uncharacterized protein n=1 Tax=Aspergillus udagawae TaxID=91492 RepID=A0A8H3PCT0_9EURO|nr:hypothetical protein IFM46972_08369 [Aspergillus udagawae]
MTEGPHSEVMRVKLKNQCHRDAFLLQRRGEVAIEACTQCAKNGGVFQSCVAAPEVVGDDDKRRVLFAGACANCIWHSKGAQCEFYAGKSSHWNSDDDMNILQQGGLRALDGGETVRDWPLDETAPSVLISSPVATEVASSAPQTETKRQTRSGRTRDCCQNMLRRRGELVERCK